MTTRTDLSKSLRAFLLKTFPALRQSPPTDMDSLLRGGAIDSMGVLEIVTFLESELGVVLHDDDVSTENFESIDAITGLVARRLAGDSAAAPGRT
jgi:acyl carrier protein